MTDALKTDLWELMGGSTYQDQDREFVALADEPLLELLRYLKSIDYRFVTATPATHARVLARANWRRARSVQDILGWSLTYVRGDVDPQIERLLERAGAMSSEGSLCRSRIRVSSLQDKLFIHSAYPTTEEHAVFFGPDSYRFADLIRHEFAQQSGAPYCRVMDIGTGAGVGAIVAAKAIPDAEVIATDINAEALRFARINAHAAGVNIQLLEGADLATSDGFFDYILANPPYIIDDGGRAYRDGGGMHGGEVALDMTLAALPRLTVGGRMILYTGSAIVNGCDPLRQRLEEAAEQHDCRMTYRELDPDVFGEELEEPAYADVDRIAVVAGVFTRAV